MKKNIVIEKKFLKILLISFVLGFITVYLIEHFGKFRYITNVRNEVRNGQIVHSSIPISTPIANLMLITPFKSVLDFDNTGFTISDVKFSDGKLRNYNVRFVFYIKATFKDFEYTFIFMVGYCLLIYFFSKFKFTYK